MKNLLFISMFLIFGIFIGCSTTEESTKKTEENKTRVVKKFVNEVNLEIDKNVSWPGPTEGISRLTLDLDYRSEGWFK